MTPPDKYLYEYAVIRYVPRVDREEFINIGLLMLNKRNRWMKSMVIIDETRIKALYPLADIECLKTQSKIFENPDIPEKSIPIEEKYRWLTAVKSACIQVSPSHPGILSPLLSDSSTSLEQKDPSELMEIEFSRLFYSLIL